MKKILKRGFSCLLCLTMVVTILPSKAFAEEAVAVLEEETEENREVSYEALETEENREVVYEALETEENREVVYEALETEENREVSLKEEKEKIKQPVLIEEEEEAFAETLEEIDLATLDMYTDRLGEMAYEAAINKDFYNNGITEPSKFQVVDKINNGLIFVPGFFYNSRYSIMMIYKYCYGVRKAMLAGGILENENFDSLSENTKKLLRDYYSSDIFKYGTDTFEDVYYELIKTPQYKSYEEQLLKVIEIVNKAIPNGQPLEVSFEDFERELSKLSEKYTIYFPDVQSKRQDLLAFFEEAFAEMNKFISSSEWKNAKEEIAAKLADGNDTSFLYNANKLESFLKDHVSKYEYDRFSYETFMAGSKVFINELSQYYKKLDDMGKPATQEEEKDEHKIQDWSTKDVTLNFKIDIYGLFNGFISYGDYYSKIMDCLNESEKEDFDRLTKGLLGHVSEICYTKDCEFSQIFAANDGKLINNVAFQSEKVKELFDDPYRYSVGEYVERIEDLQETVNDFNKLIETADTPDSKGNLQSGYGYYASMISEAEAKEFFDFLLNKGEEVLPAEEMDGFKEWLETIKEGRKQVFEEVTRAKSTYEAYVSTNTETITELLKDASKALEKRKELYGSVYEKMISGENGLFLSSLDKYFEVSIATGISIQKDAILAKYNSVDMKAFSDVMTEALLKIADSLDPEEQAKFMNAFMGSADYDLLYYAQIFLHEKNGTLSEEDIEFINERRQSAAQVSEVIPKDKKETLLKMIKDNTPDNSEAYGMLFDLMGKEKFMLENPDEFEEFFEKNPDIDFEKQIEILNELEETILFSKNFEDSEYLKLFVGDTTSFDAVIEYTNEALKKQEEEPVIEDPEDDDPIGEDPEDDPEEKDPEEKNPEDDNQGGNQSGNQGGNQSGSQGGGNTQPSASEGGSQNTPSNTTPSQAEGTSAGTQVVEIPGRATETPLAAAPSPVTEEIAPLEEVEEAEATIEEIEEEPTPLAEAEASEDNSKESLITEIAEEEAPLVSEPKKSLTVGWIIALALASIGAAAVILLRKKSVEE